MTGIVIIGAGECGVRAAFALRDQGFTGSVTLLGDERALPYERPPLSKETARDAKPIYVAERYESAGITLRLNSYVSKVEPARKQVMTAVGETLSYDKLLLATGSRARVFPSMRGCLTLRTDQDAKAIHARMQPGARIGIIGGGFIGLELAATARKCGAEVTVIEAAERLMARAVPSEITKVVQDRHLAEGVSLRLSTGVERANATQVTLSDGTELVFDTVISGVGAVPNTNLAEVAGLGIENGISVDGCFRTTDPHIFAAGDCCNFEWRGRRVRLESWKAAQDQGTHVAATMLGAEAPFDGVPWFWSDQYDLNLQVAGLFDLNQPILPRGTGSESAVVFQVDAAGRVIAAAGIGPGNAVGKDIRIFEKLIERGASVDAGVLADPTQNLKRLLRAA